MALKTNYVDEALDTAKNANKKYFETTNSDGTKSFTDVSAYLNDGDTFGAKDINATNTKVNELDNQLGGTTITYNSADGHFYAKKGDITKKLGSGEGNATASQVLQGVTFTSEKYNDKKTGTMPNRGAVSKTLDTSSTSYTVPEGYHNGSGSVSISLQSKSVNPSTNEQTVTPDSGRVLSSVSVGAIQTETKTATPTASDQKVSPSSGKYLSSVTVKGVSVSLPSASNILTGSSASVTSNGTTLGSVNGSMSDFSNSTKDSTASTDANYTYLTVPANGYYNTGAKLRTPNSNIYPTTNIKIKSAVFLNASTHGNSDTDGFLSRIYDGKLQLNYYNYSFLVKSGAQLKFVFDKKTLPHYMELTQYNDAGGMNIKVNDFTLGSLTMNWGGTVTDLTNSSGEATSDSNVRSALLPLINAGGDWRTERSVNQKTFFNSNPLIFKAPIDELTVTFTAPSGTFTNGWLNILQIRFF